MPVDLSNTDNAIQSRREGREEGLREGHRDMVRRVLDRRFGDPALTDRVSAIPDTLLLEAIDQAATETAEQFTAWLDQQQF